MIETSDPRDVFIAGFKAAYELEFGPEEAGSAIVATLAGEAYEAWYHAHPEAHRDAYRLELVERALADYLTVPAGQRRYVAANALANRIEAALAAELPEPPTRGQVKNALFGLRYGQGGAVAGSESRPGCAKQPPDLLVIWLGERRYVAAEEADRRIKAAYSAGFEDAKGRYMQKVM